MSNWGPPPGASRESVTFAEMVAMSSPSSGSEVFVNNTTVQDVFVFDSVFGWKSPDYKIYNNDSGSTLNIGDATVSSTTTDNSVELTTTFSNQLATGTVVIGGANSTDVLIKHHGEVMANKFGEAFVNGEFIMTGTSSRLIFHVAVPVSAGIYGRVLADATAGAAQVKIIMFGINVVSG